MYKIGDYIVKANTGVCKIENISHLDMPGVDKNKLYYQLMPLEDGKGTIYLLVENAESKTRSIMSREHALQVIENISAVEEFQFTNDKLREQKYKEVIRENNPEELLKLIKTIYLRNEERSRQGKKNTTVDEYYFSLTEKSLFSELRLVLGKTDTEIHDLIAKSINHSHSN